MTKIRLGLFTFLASGTESVGLVRVFNSEFFFKIFQIIKKKQNLIIVSQKLQNVIFKKNYSFKKIPILVELISVVSVLELKLLLLQLRHHLMLLLLLMLLVLIVG